MTKKVKIIISSVCAAVLLFIIILVSAISCNNKKSNDTPGESTHTHTYATAWTSDETKHWHASSCGHDVKSDEATHTFVNAVCSVCGYEMQPTAGIKYELSSDGASYVASGVVDGVKLSGDVVFASSYEGKPVTSIGKSAFSNFDNIKQVIIPDSVTSIEDNAFYGASITGIKIGKNVTSIGVNAFFTCINLTSITIPENMVSIGNNAFYYCVNLVEVINKSNIDIKKDENNGYVGAYTLKIKTSGDSDIVNKDEYLFYTIDDTNYLVRYLGNETDLVLPENYNGKNYTIKDYALNNCETLSSVVIGDHVSSIGKYAFAVTNITKITIGNSVTSIGNYAFSDCSYLDTVIMGNQVTSIGQSAFRDCDDISKLYYCGTKEQWDAISIDDYENDTLKNATRYYYSESKPSDTTNKYWHYVDSVPSAWNIG